MSEWQQGTVVTGREGPIWRVKVSPGQVWDYKGLLLAVVTTSPEGEVVLRPQDKAAASAMFPPDVKFEKGKPGACPFLQVTERLAKGSNGKYEPGDFLVHEAWDVWRDMKG